MISPANLPPSVQLHCTVCTHFVYHYLHSSLMRHSVFRKSPDFSGSQGKKKGRENVYSGTTLLARSSAGVNQHATEVILIYAC